MSKFLALLAAFMIVFFAAGQARAQDVTVDQTYWPLRGTDAGPTVRGSTVGGPTVRGSGALAKTDFEHGDVLVADISGTVSGSQFGSTRYGVMGSAIQHQEMAQSLRGLSMPRGSAR